MSSRTVPGCPLNPETLMEEELTPLQREVQDIMYSGENVQSRVQVAIEKNAWLVYTGERQ